MNKIGKISVLLIVLTLTITPQYPKAQVVEAAIESVGVGSLIKNIVDGLTSIIGRAEAAGDFVLARSAQEMLFVIDAFERASEDILDEAFKNIGNERKAFINQMITTTNQLDEGVELSLDRAENMLDQVDRLIRDVTFKSEPVVFRYRGTIAVPGETQNLRINIQGANLTGGAPVFKFRDKEYEVKKSGENLIVELPRSLFDETDQSTTESQAFSAGISGIFMVSAESSVKSIERKVQVHSEYAQLTLERKYGGFLGFFQDTGTVTYDLNIVTLPEHLGRANLSYKRKKIATKDKHYKKEESHNSSSRSWDCKSYAYSPATTERRFNPDRSSVVKGSGNSRGKLESVRITATGISFQLCAKRNVLDKDNGFRHAHADYFEVWNETSWVNHNTDGVLTWTSDLVLKAGSSTTELLAEVSLFTGYSHSYTASGAVRQYANISFDVDQNLIIIRPQIPGDLKRL